MDIQNINWDIADSDFNSWVNGEKEKNNIPLTEILKSTYLAFRKKQSDMLVNICNHALELWNEKERRRIEEDLKFDSHLRFQLTRETETEYQIRVQTRNDEIIHGILLRDQQVFNRLYEEDFPKVVRLVLENSGNIDLAKDIFQDGLVIFIEKIYHQNLVLTCSVSTYLYSICRNLWLEQLRKDRKNIPLNDSYDYPEENISIIGNDGAPDVYEEVQCAIEALGEPCKKLLESFYYKKMSWEKIASSLGYASAASARNQKYNCLEHIRHTLRVVVE